jgi:hypothetical protein
MLPGPRKVVDQASLNCCVSCAVAAAMEILHPDWPALAALFHYYAARHDISGGADARGSLFLDKALEVAAIFGVCRSTEHAAEFTSSGAESPPSPTAYRDGRGRTLSRRGRFPGFDEIRSRSRFNEIRRLLKAGRPALIGLKLPRSYPRRFLDTRYRWLDPNRPGNNVYRHCVLATGYNDAEGALRVLDSRGPSEFDGGSWWLGRVVVDSTVVEEAYALPR